jgi:hypothetical protein
LSTAQIFAAPAWRRATARLCASAVALIVARIGLGMADRITRCLQTVISEQDRARAEQDRASAMARKGQRSML